MDGPNATEENGALDPRHAKLWRFLALNDLRTMVFPMMSALRWSLRYDARCEKYPDLIKKTVAAVTVEHLGCREWLDDVSFNYKAMGKTGSIAITQGDGRTHRRARQHRSGGVVNRSMALAGRGRGLSRRHSDHRIPQPNYLCADPTTVRSINPAVR
jgi:hypothetical protein